MGGHVILVYEYEYRDWGIATLRRYDNDILFATVRGSIAIHASNGKGVLPIAQILRWEGRWCKGYAVTFRHCIS
jgi:hypothetical protein